MNELNGYDIEDLSVGMSATFSKTITEADIVLFAGVSGDMNAMHINEEYAAGTAFKGRIAHGMLSASVISAAVANRLPGAGAIYMEQNLKFLAPVRAGDTVHATVRVSELTPERGRVVLQTTCTVKDVIVIDGQALIKVDSSVRRAAKAAAAALTQAALA
jgi:3-hydroxybutyryl-CoA dehydratase